MTIDEHFVYMVVLEAIIFFTGMALMYYQQKRTADYMEKILSEPEYAAKVFAHGVLGMMERVQEDEKSKAVFFGFVQACGITAVTGIQNYFSGAQGVPEVHLKRNHPLKGFEGVLNQMLPGVLNKIMGGVEKGAGKKAAEAAETVVLEGW